MKKLVSIVISIMLALASMSMLLVGVGCSHLMLI